jgi:hypothetical protein
VEVYVLVDFVLDLVEVLVEEGSALDLELAGDVDAFEGGWARAWWGLS